MATRVPSGKEALQRLQAFRYKVYESFGVASELSDVMWFATWSGGSTGDRLAKGLLRQSKKDMLFLVLRVGGQFWVQNFLRVRNLILKTTDFDASKSIVVQAWRKSDDVLSEPSPKLDRFFGSLIGNLAKENKKSVVYFDFLADQLPVDHPVLRLEVPSAVLARTEYTRFFDFFCLFSALKLCGRYLFSCVHLIRRSENICEFLAAFVVWISVANQRSRHSYQLFLLLDRDLKKYRGTLPNLYVPCECQPEQNALIHAWKSNGGHVIGYLHGTMLTFPSHYIKPKVGAPDVLWVHGDAYPAILRLIGWLDIERKPAYRFLNFKSTYAVEGAVYFPYWTFGIENAVDRLKNAVKEGRLKIRELRPHPSTGLKLSLRKQLEPYLQAQVGTGVVVMGPVSVVLEELEKRSPHPIIHIPISDLGMDSFQQDIWEDYLEVEPYGGAHGIFIVSLKKQNAFIDFGS